MNYSQIMSPLVPLCLEKWGVMTPPSSYGSAAPDCHQSICWSSRYTNEQLLPAKHSAYRTARNAIPALSSPRCLGFGCRNTGINSGLPANLHILCILCPSPLLPAAICSARSSLLIVHIWPKMTTMSFSFLSEIKVIGKHHVGYLQQCVNLFWVSDF